MGEQTDATSVRVRCRYGAQCKRKNTEHFNEFAHPGDADWTDADKEVRVPADSSAAASTTSSPAPAPAAKQRPCCRYGSTCYRKGAEHRSTFAHPGDSDWSASSVMNNACSNDCDGSDAKKRDSDANTTGYATGATTFTAAGA